MVEYDDSDLPRLNYAAFIVIWNKERDKVLMVKRSDDDRHLPGIWGLPAAIVFKKQTYEQAMVEAAENMLGIKIKPIKFIGRKNTGRGDSILHGEEYEAEIIKGEPKIVKHKDKKQVYVDVKFDTPDKLIPAARKGSLCSRIFLLSMGVGYHDDEIG